MDTIEDTGNDDPRKDRIASSLSYDDNCKMDMLINDTLMRTLTEDLSKDFKQ